MAHHHLVAQTRSAISIPLAHVELIDQLCEQPPLPTGSDRAPMLLCAPGLLYGVLAVGWKGQTPETSQLKCISCAQHITPSLSTKVLHTRVCLCSGSGGGSGGGGYDREPYREQYPR